MDHYGPKWFLISGSFIYGAGLVALTKIHTLPQLFVVYVVTALGFSFTALVPINTLLTNWFIRRRGFAMSITSNGLSVGGMIMVPLTSLFILRFGFIQALYILACIYIFIIVPVTLIFIKQRPSDIGQFPDGDTQKESIEHNLNRSGTQMQTWTRWQAAKTVAFWSIAVSFMLSLASQLAYLVHQVSFLSRYFGHQQAAATVSITTGAAILARFVLGFFIDRLDKRYVTMACVTLQGTAVITLAFSSHTAVLYLCTFAFGLTMGPLMMMQSLIIGECFGIPSFATVSGSIGLITVLGAAFGPVIAGMIFDMTQSYSFSFMLFATASFLSGGVIYFAKPPVLKK